MERYDHSKDLVVHDHNVSLLLYGSLFGVGCYFGGLKHNTKKLSED